jgi:hypothetical protein
MNQSLVLETKLFNLSTNSKGCTILNQNKNCQSLCQYYIPNMIHRDESIEYISFSVPYAVIPVSFYIINENNNRLDININGVNSSYFFDYGNYNATYFISKFVTLLGSQWNITLNSNNSIFTITNSTNNFTLLASSTISQIMGFNTNLTSNANSLLLTNCCNFLPLPRITLRCAELANTCMVTNENIDDDVVITIPNNARPNGQIYYINASQSKLLFRHHDLNRFVLGITDDDGNLLNFNGCTSYFTFQFDIYRKFVPKLDKFSEIINMVNNHHYNNSIKEFDETIDDNI